MAYDNLNRLSAVQKVAAATTGDVSSDSAQLASFHTSMTPYMMS